MTLRVLDVIPKRNYPAFGDLVMQMHNGLLGRFDVADILRNLDQHKEWGYIIPRIMTRNISVEYTLQEMPIWEMSQDGDGLSAEIYRKHDSVMVKHSV